MQAHACVHNESNTRPLCTRLATLSDSQLLACAGKRPLHPQRAGGYKTGGGGGVGGDEIKSSASQIVCSFDHGSLKIAYLFITFAQNVGFVVWK